MREINVMRGKYAFKTEKGHYFKKKKGVRDNGEFGYREVQNLKEPIILRWSYLWHPPLDHIYVWTYSSSHTPLLTDRRDWKVHNPFDRNHHQTFPGKQKKIHLQGSFGRRLILSLPPLNHAYFCICGVPKWCLHSGRWK